METVHQLTVSPDFTPDHISGWYVFNTWLQRNLGLHIHLEMYDSFEAQRQAIQADRVDMIYANPYDASMLVREKGFRAVARPLGIADECVIVVPAESTVQHVEDLQPGARVASTDDPDIRLVGMIMLEAADLHKGNIESVPVDGYVLVAKALLQGRADVGFFLKDAWDGLSNAVRKQLRPLVTSQISDIQHAFLVGPHLAGSVEDIQGLLVRMGEIEKGAGVLESLGFQGWEALDHEETEFMIDLMDTLKAE
ncbi:MAG: phosphate/phosphite/phosphonate ABC transporter substrate-binding protein [Halothiobacillaceae bacterium]|nr:MAG: phosphate/phosphite/phosphonate ABC transporter substrate-binding protein [Halothiobacillaceae bacterium]